MALDKRQIEAIEYLVEGNETKTNIAKLVGVSRQRLYDWLDMEEFSTELDKRIHTVKHQATKSFDAKMEIAKDKLWEIIVSDVDVRTREKALEYWINRSLGTPTSKIESIVKEDKESVNMEDYFSDVDKVEE